MEKKEIDKAIKYFNDILPYMDYIGINHCQTAISCLEQSMKYTTTQEQDKETIARLGAEKGKLEEEVKTLRILCDNSQFIEEGRVRMGRIKELEQELKRYENLTPIGSEFVNSPSNVYNYIEWRLNTDGNKIKDEIKKNRILTSENKALREALQEIAKYKLYSLKEVIDMAKQALGLK